MRMNCQYGKYNVIFKPTHSEQMPTRWVSFPASSDGRGYKNSAQMELIKLDLFSKTEHAAKYYSLCG